MLVLLSPAKRLNEENAETFDANRQPEFLAEAEKVNKSLRKMSVKKLMDLQKISKELALQNHFRNQVWQTQQKKDCFFTAIHLFNGDAYLGLDAKTLSEKGLNYAQKHLRILSGLYGILKPNDQIEPYRLEMGTSIKVGRPNNLYEFWQQKITPKIATEFEGQPIVNLASNEYSKAVDLKSLKNTVINVTFKDANAKGEYKVMSFFAKKARGMMARHIFENQINNPEQLIAFHTEGYRFSEADSTPNNLLFLRDH